MARQCINARNMAERREQKILQSGFILLYRTRFDEFNSASDCIAANSDYCEVSAVSTVIML